MVKSRSKSSLSDQKQNKIVVPVNKSDSLPPLSNSGAKKVRKLLDFKTVSWIWEKKDGDYISQLPDDVLGSILSRLTLTEAARTSVLSKRWQTVWTVYPGILYFDGSRILQELRFRGSNTRSVHLPVEQLKFVNSVNHALIQYQDLKTVDELRICFDLGPYKCEIDSWIKFAIEKKVKRFRLDLTSCGDNLYGEYVFPLKSLTSSSFSSLRILHLISVAVTGKVIQKFLSNSSFLEVLYIEGSSCLGNLKVSKQSSLKLKHLDLRWNRVESVEISAINLVSLQFHGQRTTVISFKDVPNLTEVSLGGSYCDDQFIPNFSSCLSQLQNLTLDLSSKMFGDAVKFSGFVMIRNFPLPKFPKLDNLKQMKLRWHALNKEVPLYYLSLIGACTSLDKLSLQVKHSEEDWELPWKFIKRPKHQHLKVVEIVGFTGLSYDRELILYLLEYAMYLEKIIIDPSKFFWLKEGVSSSENMKELKAARSRAREMKSILPKRVKLVIR